MNENVNIHKTAKGLRRYVNTIRYSIVTILCASVLVAGFFFAGRQHFSSMDYSIRNSRLRNQLAQLESEKRRLLLTKEISLSPSELQKAVKRISYVSPDEKKIETGPKDAEKALTTPLKQSKLGIVQKTVSVKPIPGPKRPDEPDKPIQAKRDTSAKEKRNRT